MLKIFGNVLVPGSMTKLVVSGGQDIPECLISSTHLSLRQRIMFTIDMMRYYIQVYFFSYFFWVFFLLNIRIDFIYLLVGFSLYKLASLWFDLVSSRKKGGGSVF